MGVRPRRWRSPKAWFERLAEMPGLRPTKAFTGVTLELATIRPGQRFGRIYHERYPDPLGFGKTKSRADSAIRAAARRMSGLVFSTWVSH